MAAAGATELPVGRAVAPPAEPVTASQVAADPDYSLDRNWLCRPGRDDTCSQPWTVANGGSADVQAFRANPLAPVDSFYVYATVSADATANSDVYVGPEEERAVQHQLIAFGRECRLFAPVYRQATLAALRSRFTGSPVQADAQMAYGDERSAWAHYLDRDNQGRGVVLIGHSQGARMLVNLIAREIEGKPVQRRIIEALLLGSNIAVPRGRDVGGDFKTMPVCRSVAQIGCAIAYTAFRADAPPPADTLFGRVRANPPGRNDGAAFSVACTNPSALGGGPGKLQGPRQANLLGQAIPAGAGGARGQAATATFVAMPDLPAQCVEVDGVSYLSVDLPAHVPADVVVDGQVLRSWGLHLVDVNLALGDLVRIVREKAHVHALNR